MSCGRRSRPVPVSHLTDHSATTSRVRTLLRRRTTASVLATPGEKSPPALRKLALLLVAVLAAAGFLAGLTAGHGTDDLATQLVAGAVVVLIAAMLVSPLPDGLVWAALVLLAPACFAIGVRPLDHPETFVGMLLVGVTWVAAYLSRKLLATHLLAATAAAAWVLTGGHYGEAVAAATALWALVFVAVGAVVAGLSTALRGARDEMEGIGTAIGAHFYRGVLEPDGGYTELYTGPGFERLIGRAPLEDEDTGDTWMQAVHEADREGYREWLASVGAGSSDELEYRLVGVDGVTRWVLERVRVSAVENGRVHHEGLVWDVTGRRIAERNLERTRKQLNDLIEAIDEVVLQYEPGPEGWRTTFVGPGLEQLAGLPGGHDTLDPLFDSASLLDRRRIAELRHQVLRDGRGEIEYRVVDPAGAQRWISERLWVRSDGERTVIDGIASNVTERVLITAELAAARDEAERQARTDPLTGVNNRLHFSERLDAEIARVRRGGHPFGLALLDLDRFKQLNDRHGHLAGDRALVAVASRLGQRVRPYDVIARWGGEEFAVLVAQVPDESALTAVCEALRAAVAEAPIPIGAGEVTVTTSVGAVLASGPYVTADGLLASADEALYRAKGRGRNQVDVATGTASAPAASVVSLGGRRPRVR
jgi:diguanylate cyclase (GGDEF)-like protein